MPYSKLKSLMILLLALVNVVLLFLAAPLYLERQRQEEAEARELSSLFAGCGVDLTLGSLPATRTLYTLEFSPEPENAFSAARAILGDTVLPQEGSTPYLSLYASELGRCQISRSGQLDARLTGKAVTGSLERDMQTLLEQMGVTAFSVSDPVRQGTGVYTADAVQSLLDVPVWSSTLRFTFRSGALVRIEGTAHFDTTGLCRTDENACASCADALVAFLGSRDQLGWVGAELNAVSQGYLRAETASAAVVRLVPGWRVSTDTGDFWVNGITREVSPLET